MFRNSYLRYEELTHIVQGWASAHPDLVRVASIGPELTLVVEPLAE